ncbi:MAG: O-methyltransferase-domain-containing protein [Monoraphidium minutum]|nr:MAG: O-methyltransferase-domain-containing protein [Monoraphidium minutum]
MECGVVIALLAALGAAALLPLALLAGAVLIVRPWDARPRSFAVVSTAPYPLFWATCALLEGCSRLAALKPAPFRLAELASGFVQSQVLFALNDLGVPLALAAGARTAPQIAASCCPGADPEWLERLLKAAATLGLVRRVPAAAPRRRRGGAGAAAGAPAGATEGAVPGAGLTGDAFEPTALTAALVEGHPACMAHFVGLFAQHYDAMGYLSEGVRRRVAPFRLTPESGGKPFFEHLAECEPDAQLFDSAMREVDHISGGSIFRAFNWGRFDHVVDVAGGNGQFLARLLAAHPRLRGTLFDQPQQVARGKQWWELAHGDVLPRAAFAAGDMFDAATIPGPGGPRGGGRSAYVLRNILHDWDDASCLRILRAIRESACGAAGGSGKRGGKRGAAAAAPAAAPPPALLIVEATLSGAAALPWTLRHRHASDVTMMAVFGGSKERNESQFDALLAAAGWRLERAAATTGLYCVLEAVPAAAAAAR